MGRHGKKREETPVEKLHGFMIGDEVEVDYRLRRKNGDVATVTIKGKYEGVSALDGKEMVSGRYAGVPIVRKIGRRSIVAVRERS